MDHTEFFLFLRLQDLAEHFVGLEIRRDDGWMVRIKLRGGGAIKRHTPSLALSLSSALDEFAEHVPRPTVIYFDRMRRRREVECADDVGARIVVDGAREMDGAKEIVVRYRVSS